MNYEKKYNEALERARKLSVDGYLYAIAVEVIFPELRESEDERIRKYLIDFVGLSDNPRKGEMIAYLEKQKEQKPTDKEQDSIAFLEQHGYTIVPPHAPVSIVPSSEATLREWSEEDEKMMDTIVSVLSQYIDYKAVSGTGSGYATPRYSKEIDWLKSLRPQPKQEWSEKDEEALREVKLNFELNHDNMTPTLVGFYERFFNKLKSFRSQTHWKPSEEQMMALEDVITMKRVVNEAATEVLRELYVQLKKL